MGVTVVAQLLLVQWHFGINHHHTTILFPVWSVRSFIILLGYPKVDDHPAGRCHRTPIIREEGAKQISQVIAYIVWLASVVGPESQLVRSLADERDGYQIIQSMFNYYQPGWVLRCLYCHLITEQISVGHLLLASDSHA